MAQLLIQNGGKLSLQRRQLLIQQNGESHTVPLEDIAVIIIENRETLITAPLLSALAEYGSTLLTCDEQFLSCGQWLPYAQYHRQLKILKLQLNISEPLKKQLWQHIVRQKILNQAFVADETGNDLAAKRLRTLAVEVRSGDTGNREAQAAALYFQALFGEKFSRNDKNAVNAALNYTYARAPCSSCTRPDLIWLVACISLFHRSELNPFNLADDFIEPLRPLADLVVIHLYEQGRLKTDLTPNIKQKLIKTLHCQICIEQQHFSTLAAIDQMISSFQASVTNKNAKQLKLPEILPLKEYQYE